MNKHENHKKKRLYARNQSSGSKQWEGTEIFLCECGAILEQKFEVKNENTQ
jgi:hypothetical protein